MYGARACAPLEPADLRYKSLGQLLFFFLVLLSVHDFVFHFLSLLPTIVEQSDERFYCLK